MTETETRLRGLKLELLAARILLALGIAAGVAGLLLPVSFRAEPVQAGAVGGTRAPQSAINPGQKFCNSAAAIARDYGIVPEDTHATGVPEKTDVRGRYVCDAASGNSTFAISIDLVCTQLGEERCFSLFSVTQSDGSVLYQRQDQ